MQEGLEVREGIAVSRKLGRVLCWSAEGMRREALEGAGGCPYANKAQLRDALLPTRPAFVPAGRPWTHPEHIHTTSADLSNIAPERWSRSLTLNCNRKLRWAPSLGLMRRPVWASQHMGVPMAGPGWIWPIDSTWGPGTGLGTLSCLSHKCSQHLLARNLPHL